MGYQEFCNDFRKGVLENKEWNIKEDSYRFYPKGYVATDAEELNFIRVTNEKHYGAKADVLKGDIVTLRIDKGNGELVESRYALRALYDVYQRDGWDAVWQVIDSHMKILRPFQNQNLTSIFDSYENAKEYLLIRAINFTDNEVQLMQHIYRRFADIALVVYVALYNGERGFGSAKLPKTTLESWGKNCDEVFEEAFKNTMKMMPPRLYANSWIAIENNLEKGKFMEEDSPTFKLDTRAIPLVRTTKNINGAIAMFYPGVKERIAELFNGSYFVVFSSIHEARIHHAEGTSSHKIKSFLDYANEMVPKEQVLSRKVFLYNATEKTFEALEM